ncbi:hypothetical protein B0F90DRAFT_1667911 [Multifurca ochricompacta]|uniref:Uncharacterized protein n=1 Tax=Multifurca ochricompacta TaxID=376703 RepID=A0AAD4M449_9AGAM|nr:hypothetical protein B0F90DRAFT_1667911 [Multifurca ochricompacta]
MTGRRSTSPYHVNVSIKLEFVCAVDEYGECIGIGRGLVAGLVNSNGSVRPSPHPRVSQSLMIDTSEPQSTVVTRGPEQGLGNKNAYSANGNQDRWRTRQDVTVDEFAKEYIKRKRGTPPREDSSKKTLSFFPGYQRGTTASKVKSSHGHGTVIELLAELRTGRTLSCLFYWSTSTGKQGGLNEGGVRGGRGGEGE